MSLTSPSMLQLPMSSVQTLTGPFAALCGSKTSNDELTLDISPSASPSMSDTTTLSVQPLMGWCVTPCGSRWPNDAPIISPMPSQLMLEATTLRKQPLVGQKCISKWQQISSNMPTCLNHFIGYVLKKACLLVISHFQNEPDNQSCRPTTNKHILLEIVLLNILLY